MKNDWQKAAIFLKKDGVVILPTDTLYGLVGSALSKKAVKKIYKLKERNLKKPLIILIISLDDLNIFDIKIKEKQAKFFSKIWPAKISIILPCNKSKWFYLHRGTNSIAFRMIDSKNKNLFNLIKEVGLLVAPSANKEDFPPAYNISEAKKYFGMNVSYYIDEGKKKSSPSTLIEINDDGKIKILRRGSVIL